MKNKLIKNEGYHPANLPLSGNNINRGDSLSERLVDEPKVILYDKDDKALVRKIGFRVK